MSLEGESPVFGINTDVTSSVESLSEADITPEDLRLYLAGHEWREDRVVNDYLAIWGRSGLSKELYVPRSTSVADYKEQILLLVRFLAQYEERSPVQIAADLRHNGADVIRLRIDTTTFDRGTIGLRKATEVLNDAERMLSAAARAVQSPQSYYPSGAPPAEVSDYLDTTRLAQTEPGSFVFALISPVAYHSKHESALTSPGDLKPPFARRVTQTLATSLEAIRSASVFQERPLTAVFEDLVESGVSANLCDALSGIAEQSHDNAVDVDFSWSAKAPSPRSAQRERIILPPIITPALRDMAAHLKSVMPEYDFTVIGKVDRLLNQKDSEGFDLYLKANVHGTERLLALQLKNEERAVASLAWRTGQSVYVRGMLDRRYRPYRLLDPSEFGLVTA